MNNRSLSLCLAAGLAVCIGAQSVWAQITDIKVTTDKSIDCSSFQTIGADLARDKKTDEEKAIAAWYFVRRMLYHWPYAAGGEGGDSKEIDWINSNGFGLCGAQSATLVKVCQGMGLKAGSRYMPSHVTAEVFYDGGWHFFDCQVGWFAFRKDNSAVADLEEMVTDPTLVTEARKNGNGSKPFMQCRDKSDTNGSAVKWIINAKSMGNGSEKLSGKTRLPPIALLPGMTYTRCWYQDTDPATGKSNRSLNRDGAPTRHPCPPAYEADDPVNHPFWEPYMVKGDGNMPWRTYGNGRLVYSPNLRAGSFKQALAANGFAGMAQETAAGAGPALHPAEAGKTGTVIFSVSTPYFFTADAWVDGEFVRKSEQDAVTISVSKDKGNTWTAAWAADRTGTIQAKDVSLKDAVFGRWRAPGEYLVKLELLAKDKVQDAGVNRLTLTSVFVNNIYSLPYLLPGANKVRVTAAAGAKVSDQPLMLSYLWWEQGKPGKDISVEKEINKLPFECTVNVSGEKLPRMRSVTLSLPAENARSGQDPVRDE